MARPPIHPGEILADELKELGVTATELSRQIKVPTNRVTQIIHGMRGITGDTALRLGHWFGTSAQFWLNLQTAYDIRLAEEKIGKKIVANLVALGVMHKLSRIISEEAVISAIMARVPKGTEDMNIQAFKHGQELV